MLIKRLYHLFVVLLVLTSCNRGYQKVLKSPDKDFKYTKALEYYENSDWTRARPLFEELVPLFKGTKKGADVYYYFIYASYYMGDLGNASYHFKKFAQTYPTSKHAMECSFMNAYCYYEESPIFSLDQSQTFKALDALQLFANDYPNSDSIPRCNALMIELRGKLLEKDYENAQTYFHVRQYEAASIALSNVMKDFPQNKHKEEIKFLILQSNYELALNSVRSKKADRLEQTLKSYQDFIDDFPESKDLKAAENTYKKAIAEKELLNSTKK